MANTVLYGLWQEKDLGLDAVAAGVDREALLDAQNETLAMHNREIAATLGIFADFTTDKQAAVKTGADARMQPLDENGRPLPIKGRGHYFVGFPIWKAGTAEGYNFWTREQMTVQDFADSLNLMLHADINWVADELLSTIFYNGAGLSYSNANAGDSYTVYGAANGDTVVYDKSTGAATDDHFSASATAISDAADVLDTIEVELNEHPQNTGRIVSFIPANQEAAIRLLTKFAPVRTQIINVVPASTGEQTEPLFAPGLNLPLSTSMEYIGMHGSTYIVRWNRLPSDYIVSVAVDATVKPLGARQYPQQALQGLVNIGEPMAKFPYQQTNFVRALGFGARNRVGLQVHKVAASYASPTNLTFPLA